ncbi:hypothetical protein GE061_016061, partial [Apolygus lucorum]
MELEDLERERLTLNGLINDLSTQVCFYKRKYKEPSSSTLNLKSKSSTRKEFDVLLLGDSFLKGLGEEVGIVWLAILSGGMSTSFPAIGIPALTDAGVDLSPAQVSVVGSVRQAGIIVGALITGPLLDNYGRRKGILGSIIPGILGYLVICSSGTITALCIGLLLQGVSMGMMNSAGAVYLAELVSKEWRGSVTVARNVFMSIGLTITYILGLVIKGNIRLISFVAFFIPTMAFLLGLCFIDETKLWAQQSKTGEKKKSFAALYADFWRALTSRPDVYKPFGILNFVNFLRHTSGVVVITNYTINIITDTGTASDPYIVAIILGIIRTGAAIMSVVLCTFFGRRTMMFSSGILMTVSMIGLALLQYMAGWPKLTPEAFLALFISSSVVFLSISMSLQGEIYPTEFRGMCSSATMTLSNVQSVIVLATYPLLKAWIGFDFVMAIYAVASAGCVLFTFFMVPDTDNKTLDEIGRMFRKNSG